MPKLPIFTPPSPPFMGAKVAASLADLAGLSPRVAFFGAPHGTPYPGIDNEPHAASPASLRKAITLDSEWLDHWDFDLDGPVLAGRDLSIADLGDLATRSQDGEGNRAMIEATTRAILTAGAVPLMSGGDDSTPIPFLAAFADHGPITIVQVDAHIDWRQERRGEPLGYSSTMRRASEMAHVERIVHVGIRGLGSARRGEVETARQRGARIVTARQVHEQGVAAALAHVPDGARVVVTFDCDALDGGIMPAVMAPTPGGLTYLQAIDLIAGITQKGRLVGMDMIELVPSRDATGAACYLAARILWHTVGRLARA